MTTKQQTLYGLKFNPFRPDVPVEALYCNPAIDAFLRRVELGIADGGYVMITGDPGTGKSVTLRLLAKRLASIRDVAVGTIEHPQSRTMDFYRELGELFGLPLQAHNRWGGFKALRERWSEHIATTLTRPVLIIDEAQETLPCSPSCACSPAKHSTHVSSSASSWLAMAAFSSDCVALSFCPSVAASDAASPSTTPPATSSSLASTICSTSPATPRS